MQQPARQIKTGQYWRDKDPRSHRTVKVIQTSTLEGTIRIETVKSPVSLKAIGRKTWVRSSNLRSRFTYLGDDYEL